MFQSRNIFFSISSNNFGLLGVKCQCYARACPDPYLPDGLNFRFGQYVILMYPWWLQIGIVTKVQGPQLFLWPKKVCMLRARTCMDLDPAVSKLESWLMAHFEATLMYITNNHFKTLLRAIWGIYGPKTVKKQPKNEPN